MNSIPRHFSKKAPIGSASPIMSVSKTYSLVAAFFIATASLFLVSCSSNEAKLASHLKKANELFDNDDYATAEIEYLNALQADGESVEAIARLGIIYYDQVRLRKAFPYLARAAELDSNNQEIRYRLGFVYLLSGDFANARKQAEAIIAVEPSNQHAPILLANTATNPEELEQSVQQLKSLRERAPENPSVLAALAILYGRTQQNNQAEALLKQALEIDSTSYYTYLVLRGLHLSNGNTEAALEALKSASEHSPLRSANKVDLAQQYLANGDQEAYQQVIDPILKKAPKFVPALLLSARYHTGKNQLGEARKRVNSVLSLDPTNHDAILLSGNLYLAERQIPEALEAYEEAVQFFPQSPVAHYNLARATLADNRNADARNSLLKALSLNPDYPEAMALMAQLQLQSGEYNSAETHVRKLLSRSPENLNLKLQLAAIKRGQGEVDEALVIYNELEASHTENAQLPLLRAQLYAQQNDAAAAKKAIEKSLQRDPDYLLALDLLTSFLIPEERFSYALDQVRERIARKPEVAGYYLIEAKIHIANKDFDNAEKQLLKAIELDPDNRTPYIILSQVYVRDEKREAALERLQQVVSKNPEDISALMIMCGIYEYEKQYENARYTYEKIIKVNPNFPPALNNLAYLYSEIFGKHDEAYKYANRARQLLPHDPAIADTLGWILFKRGDIEWGRGLIQESVEKLPANAEVRYHLGMTYYMLGDEETARDHFETALSLAEEFNGKEDLEDRLAILEIGSSDASTRSIPELEKMAKSYNDDPVLLMRLAQAYEINGESGNALETYEKVLAQNSNYVPALLKAANLQLNKGNTKAALELGKEAYKLQANDPAVASQLGKFAYLEKDYEWSASLLRSAARNRPSDAEILTSLALSLVSVGEDQEAREHLLAIPERSRTPRATHLLDFLNAIEAQNANEIRAHANSLNDNLINDWSKAAIAKIEGNGEEAAEHYQKLISSYPTFTIAKRELTFINALNGEHSVEALSIATEARRAYPNNKELQAAVETIQTLKEEAESL